MLVSPALHCTRCDVLDLLRENYEGPEFTDEGASSRYRAKEIQRKKRE